MTSQSFHLTLLSALNMDSNACWDETTLRSPRGTQLSICRLSTENCSSTVSVRLPLIVQGNWVDMQASTKSLFDPEHLGDVWNPFGCNFIHIWKLWPNLLMQLGSDDAKFGCIFWKGGWTHAEGDHLEHLAKSSTNISLDNLLCKMTLSAVTYEGYENHITHKSLHEKSLCHKLYDEIWVVHEKKGSQAPPIWPGSAQVGLISL